ncbi:hypothetical protein F4818DRAFT_450454 [Hypoxylon cercidicola]|nr:hypothetical protein F4818DRAFT_450454 [Hypoxylon cercidicola]
MSIRDPCHICGSSAKTFVCVQCNSMAFCDSCWAEWVLHVPGAMGLGGKPHEKADPETICRLRQIFEPVRSEADHEVELLKDRETTLWKVAAIMSESGTGETTDRYPQLVSFIGETGAEKSTLIKLLIDRHDLSSSEGPSFCSPVTSSNNDYIPTTGDVHLYPEPSTFSTSTPLLLIDCEGLNGGEAAPKALRCLSQDEAGKTDSSSSQRYISWANSPQTQKREYTVSQLYPRVLYTFSDVVVFVLCNPGSFESAVLDKLVRWASASVDKSLNQPVLPHTILVLNATEDVDDKEWDVETATRMLMEAIQGAVTREPALDKYVQSWRKRGKVIKTTEDLLRQYYASVTVIRIPRRGSYMLMDQQATKLFDLIKARCFASHSIKKQVRMLANAEMLQVYLHASFDHFTRDLESPFDFVKEALRHNPVPRSFEGNILNLAVSMKNHSESEVLRSDARKRFLRLAPMVASCIMFDAVRQRILGTASRLLSDAYAELCVSALQRFADLYWPCNFLNPAYRKEHGRCCNVKSGHNLKGHQNDQGKIIGNGQYQSDFDLDKFVPKWNKLIKENLVKLQAASYELSQKLPGRTDDFISHSACFSCLRELPSCVLPCGHILCLSCVQTYGHATSRTTVEIKRCPLHVRDILAEPPWVITTKPPCTGVRVLSLDSGGINGIVELEVLRAIEKILGPKLPIRLFFDLIVGTSAGGTIALGLGVKGWSVEKTIEEFNIICKEAFTPREMTGVPLLEHLTNLYHGSLYKTQPLEKALKSSFSDQNLFGSIQSQNEMPIRVAVTSTTALEHKLVVFANYNRPDHINQSLPYEFVRPDEPAKEIKVWEAARATSATSPQFKAFLKPETKDQYVDGSLHHACPVWVAHHETKLIWGDIAHLPPDIMLSVGTGRNVRDNDRAHAGRYSRDITDTSSVISMPPVKPVGSPLPSKSAKKVDRLDDCQKCGRTWDKFKAGRVTPDSVGSEHNGRYIRISPGLNIMAPKLDDVQRLDENAPEIREVAHRLVASTFFFEEDLGSMKQTASGYTCKGSIFCRFRNSSDDMKALGRFLRTSLKGNFEPSFLIEDDIPGSVAQKVALTETMIRGMCQRGYLDIEPIRINALKEHTVVKIMICLQATPYACGDTALPISGFPRQLMSKDGYNGRSAILSQRRSSNDTHQTPDPAIRAPKSDIVGPTSRLSRHSELIVELSGSPAPTAELPADAIQMKVD